ncbi:MAG TPA: c-type cytochrome, partial [Candidatus Acidoferrum sp.]|nr:c-type cytochrome [Candidatus Acidoferrum sp.]
MRGKVRFGLVAVSAVLLAGIFASVLAHARQSDLRSVAVEGQNWSVYGGGPLNQHYSPLTQINRENVKNLEVAWKFDSGETGGLQTSPLMVDGVLYGITPTQKIFAVNAGNGTLLWKFDSGIKGTQPDRGLAYWSDGKSARILAGVMNFVYALDAATGSPIPTFGHEGRIDLREGLGREPAEAQSIVLTSPVVVYKDLFVAGGRNPETLPAPPGNIRAFDIRTGKLRWEFHTIPHPGEYGYDTWPADAWKTSGAANNWAGMSLDAARGIVYVPTGSAAADFYGGDRVGSDLFANSLLAIDANTGKRLWHFQGVHHDIWDRDFPSPPVLLTVDRGGKAVDAVAQTSKQGFVFLFDRVTGAPLFPLETRKYPGSTVPGEAVATEQSLPTKPAPFARQMLTDQMLTTRTPEAHRFAAEKFAKFRSEGQFVPFSVGKETVVFPGFDGAAEWGGPAVDPQTGIIYINSNEMAWTGALAENNGSNSARDLYLSQCGVCHGEKLAGSPPAIPSLVGVEQRLSPQEVAATIHSGKGRMQGFPNLSHDQIDALIEFLFRDGNKEIEA